VAIEQCTDNAAVQNARKRLMMRLSVPFGHKFVTLGKTAYTQTLFIRRPAAKADACG
jgi:hypothetical protein